MSDAVITDIATRAHAFLFSEGGSLTKKKLMALLSCDKKTLNESLKLLSEKLTGSGITIIQTDTEASLAVAPNASKIVRDAFERELGKEIGEAGLEVLAIVLYRGPSTRAQIDYIRGVNTASTLRNLLARGLLERTGNPEDAREYLYRPTVELLAHLGVTDTETLPEYATIASELARFEAEAKNEPFTDQNATGDPDTTPSENES